MTAEELRRSAEGAGPPPEGLAAPLLALWWQARGDWARAHEHAQSADGGTAGDWVHAHLHREEGDLANADYWYARARRTRPDAPLAEEWHAIARALLAGAATGTGA